MMMFWNMWRAVCSWLFKLKPIEYNEEEYQEVLFKTTVREECVSHL